MANENYYLVAIPFLFVVAFMALFSLEKLMWFIVFATPLSLNLEQLDIGGIGMYIPTEPLMFGIMVIFFLKSIYQVQLNNKIFHHPITWAILINLIWIFITSITSVMPVVSFKFLLARLWFVVCFYFIAIHLFRKAANYKLFFWSYIIPLSVVIVYAVLRLASYGFKQQPAHWVMEPFFKDHTSYGAILAMYFPILFVFVTKKNLTYVRVLACLFIGLFAIGLVFSYTRAAWISLLMALILFYVYKHKVKFKWLLGIGFSFVLLIIMSWNSLLMNLEKNNQESSDRLAEHMESISNISSDASNLERLNRWSSAWRMFLEKPFFGWGPGTYAFQYAPFQLAAEKTIISTNAGDNGNAHSEYIGPLVESGVLGTISFLFIVIMVYYRGSKLYHQLSDEDLMKDVVLASLLGFTTYVVHGLLNNYLDTDKASVPFWGFIALIVSIDIYHQKSLKANAK